MLLEHRDTQPVLLQEEPWLGLQPFPDRFQQELWIGFNKFWLKPALRLHKRWSALDRMAVFKAIVHVASELVDATQAGEKDMMVSVLVSSAPVVLVLAV